MLGLIGARSSIARAFVKLLPDGEEYIEEPAQPFCDRYLICQGYLAGKRIVEMTNEQALRTWTDNCADIMAECELIFDHNPEARVCIIGSESGIAGSFDHAYAAAKAGIHHYVETRRLAAPGQQLVAIAPTVIWDSGMTQRRDDLDACAARGAARRRGRWLWAREVAALAYFVLYIDSGSISNAVIRQNGGNW